jgi:cell division protein FtsI (penicillin-binding protein 3)
MIPDDDSTPERPYAHWRAGVIIFFVCALLGGVMVRAYDLQVRRADELSRQAASQVSGTVQIRARRGSIVDREGREMAISVRAESVFSRPDRIAQPEAVAERLTGPLHMSQESLAEILRQDAGFRWLSRRVSPETAGRVRDLDIPGIETVQEWQRYYPMRERAGQIIGFTGDDDSGLEGLEMLLDDLLRGERLEVQGLRDAYGQRIVTRERPNLETLEGSSVVLTIDANIQRVTEREIQRVVLEHDARTAVAIVMDPHTGEILAMTSWPSFDPNAFRTSRPEEWRNRAVTDSWEPGSTFKIFTYAAALDAGEIRPNTRIDSAGGRLRIGRHRIRDTHHDHEQPAWRVIQTSSNIGAYRMAERLGDVRFHQAILDFGFGASTRLGLSGEQVGLVAQPPWAEIELANRAFGQGITVTPLQMALGYSVIANGGLLMAPMLVREIRNIDGDTLERFEPVVRRRVISERTAQQATDALESVTAEDGTGTRGAIPGIRVAAKTGTAQKVNPETGRYDDLWMASFIGFVPADDPMFTIVVMVDEPQGSHYGGTVAAPVFTAIAEEVLAMRGIFRSSDGPDSVEADEVEDDSSVAEVTPFVAEVPEFDEPLGDRTVVPDFAGLDLVSALALAEDSAVTVDIEDWGVVQHQWPAAGSRVQPGSSIALYLAAPYRLSQTEHR